MRSFGRLYFDVVAELARFRKKIRLNTKWFVNILTNLKKRSLRQELPKRPAVPSGVGIAGNGFTSIAFWIWPISVNDSGFPTLLKITNIAEPTTVRNLAFS